MQAACRLMLQLQQQVIVAVEVETFPSEDALETCDGPLHDVDVRWCGGVPLVRRGEEP